MARYGLTAAAEREEWADIMPVVAFYQIKNI